MFSNRAAAAAEQRPDVVVRQPAGDERHHVELARCQPMGRLDVGELDPGPVPVLGLELEGAEPLAAPPETRQPGLAARGECPRKPLKLRL